MEHNVSVVPFKLIYIPAYVTVFYKQLVYKRYTEGDAHKEHK